MRLYLVRHAEAVTKHEDPERPLTGSGSATVHRVAAFLKQAGLQAPVEIRHSGKLRARQTAAILSAEAGLEAPLKEVTDLEPLAHVGELAESLVNATDDLMLVGHLPHLNRLASLLVAGDADLDAFEFAAGSVMCISRGPGQGGQSSWSVRWLLDPGLLP